MSRTRGRTLLSKLPESLGFGFSGSRVRKGACASVAAAILLSPSAVLAEEGANLEDIRANLNSSIDINLVGSVPARCFVSGGREVALGYIRGGETASANFGLDCNLPFEVKVQSLRGGLAHATTPQGEGPFSGLLEYDLKLTIPTLRPTPDAVSGEYTSRDLRGSKTLSSRNGIGAGFGTLEFRMHHPEGAGLLAGDYSEVLTVVISPTM